MFGNSKFPWLAVLLLGGLAATARADEWLEPIAQDDDYADQSVEPQAPSRADRLRAQMVSDGTEGAAPVIGDVQPCAWAEDDCGAGSKLRWLHIPLPIPADTSCWRWVAGTEVTFLAPSFRGTRVNSNITDGAGTNVNYFNNNSYNAFTYAPRIWIGKQGECWGVMARFWYLSDYNSVINPIIANGQTQGGSAINGVKAYTVDLEALRMFTKCDGSRCWLTLGARYASLSSDSVLNSMAVLGGPDFATAYAATSSRFNGVGLTTAFYGYKPICCSDFSLFYSVRNSIIFGNNESQAAAATGVQGLAAGTGTSNSAISNAGSTLYIGEIQLGAQWNHQFKCIPMNGFFRLAGEYQFWGSNNSISEVISTSALGTNSATAAAYGGKADLSFVGFAIATGCTF